MSYANADVSKTSSQSFDTESIPKIEQSDILHVSQTEKETALQSVKHSLSESCKNRETDSKSFTKTGGDYFCGQFFFCLEQNRRFDF